jgi:hypothetical protein
MLRVLLPLAYDGLRTADVAENAIERYLGVVEQRCLTRRNGSRWQREIVALAQRYGADRETALCSMLAKYLELANTGEAVHTWPTEL